MPWQGDRARRFMVHIENLRGDEHEYPVTTWRSEAKAVALAVVRHRALGRGHILDVRAEGIGLALSEDGSVKAPDEDLVDRYEW